MKKAAEIRLGCGLCAAAVALALSGPARAAEDDLDCRGWANKSLNQNEMNMCQEQDFEAADAQLNAAYRKLTAQLEAQDKALLIAAQRAWIAFRDKECTFETNESEGGSIHPMLYTGCQTGLTKARTREINEIIKERTGN